MASLTYAAIDWYGHITDPPQMSEPYATFQIIFGIAGTRIYCSKTSGYYM